MTSKTLARHSADRHRIGLKESVAYGFLLDIRNLREQCLRFTKVKRP